jgi:hypothetical protein
MFLLSARWRHIQKGQRESSTHTDNLDTRWEWSPPRSGRFIPRGKSLGSHCICGWEGLSSENRKWLLYVNVNWAPRPDDAGLQGNRGTAPSIPEVPCTLSVTLSDFTVWRHTWRKKLVNCAVLTDNSIGFKIVLSSRLSHTQNCAVHSGNPTVSSFYLSKPRWHHLKACPFLAIHSAGEHRMIYSFSNTTSYSTFYTFISSFRITLWPIK